MKYSAEGINTLEHISAFEEAYVGETELSQIVVNEPHCIDIQLNDEFETNASLYEETSEIDGEDVHVNNDDCIVSLITEIKTEMIALKSQ